MTKPVISGNTISIPSDPEYLADVDIFIEGILRGFGADESTIADIAISVSELVNNSITHGNKLSSDKLVTVTIGRNNSKIEISVTDQGTGFNPDEIDNPIAQENLLKEVGRGIFIIRSLMDSVEIESTGKGTKTTIHKTI